MIDTSITQKAYDELAQRYAKNWKKLNMTRNYRKKFADYVKTGTVADLGCGSGFDTHYFSRNFNAVGVDFSKEIIRIARKKFPDLQFICADMRKVSFGENSLAGVWLSQSMHHLPKEDWISLLKKMKKWLRKGGIVFFISKEGQFEVLTKKSAHPFFPGKKRYTANYEIGEIEKILESLNYKIIHISKKTGKDENAVFINVFARNVK